MYRTIIALFVLFAFVGCRENRVELVISFNMSECFVDGATSVDVLQTGGVCESALKEYAGEESLMACMAIETEQNRKVCNGIFEAGTPDIALEGCTSDGGKLEELDTEGDRITMKFFLMEKGVGTCPDDLTTGKDCDAVAGCLFALRPVSGRTEFDDESISFHYGDDFGEMPCQPECNARSELCLAPGATVASCLNPEPVEGEGEGVSEGEGEEPPFDECRGCTNPPPNECDGEGNVVEYDSLGICVNGERCLYDEDMRPCRFGCSDGKCKDDPCALGCEGEGEGASAGEGEGEGVGEGEGEGEGQPDPCEDVVCEDPPVNLCDLQEDVVEFDPAGECAEGECSYDSIILACQFGCEDANCLPDPCEGVVCQGREPRCEGNVLVSEVNGQCDGGICSYTIHQEPDPLCAPQGEGEGEGPVGEGEGEGPVGEGEGEGPPPGEGEGEGPPPGEGEGEGVGEGEGEGEGEGQPDPCEGLLICEEEQVTCDGPETIVRCQLNADGCLVETREPPPEGWSCIPATGPDGFLMGSPPNEVGRGDDEVQHQVVITRPFLAKQIEVTQAEWRAIMGNNPSAFPNCDDCPVEQTHWYDALAYANALSRVQGLEECYALGDASWPRGLDCTGYRLPTEAEWEYAARAGSQDARYAEPLTDLGWYSENSGARTNPVGQKSPNPWGLYDTLGNVWEFMWDINGGYPADAVTDPTGPPGEEGNRVIRGGAWNHLADDCRSANRSATNPSSRGGNIGFRLVRTIQ